MRECERVRTSERGGEGGRKTERQREGGDGGEGRRAGQRADGQARALGLEESELSS